MINYKGILTQLFSFSSNRIIDCLLEIFYIKISINFYYVDCNRIYTSCHII